MILKEFRCIAPNIKCVELLKDLLLSRITPKTIFPDRCNEIAFFIYFYNNMLSFDEIHSYDAYKKHTEEELTFEQAVERISAVPVFKPIPDFKFEPFDQILRQSKHKDIWQIGIYSHIGIGEFIGMNNTKILKMVSYKENKHLLNTTQKPVDGYWECDDDCEPVYVRS